MLEVVQPPRLIREVLLRVALRVGVEAGVGGGQTLGAQRALVEGRRVVEQHAPEDHRDEGERGEAADEHQLAFDDLLAQLERLFKAVGDAGEVGARVAREADAVRLTGSGRCRRGCAASGQRG